MKQIKKIIGLILITVIILTAVPVQSFALFDSLNPIVIGIEPADDIPVSNKLIQLLKNDTLGSWILLEGIVYKFKVKFSNGKSYITDNDFSCNGSDEESGIADIYVLLQAQCDYSALMVAMEKNVIKVIAYVFVEYTNGDSKIFPFIIEKPFVNEIVDEVRFVGEMPEISDVYYPENDLYGEKFEIKYGDGTKKIFPLEITDNGYATLDDYPIFLYYEEDTYYSGDELVYYKGVGCHYLDELTLLHEVTYPGPYNNFEIVDYKFDGNGCVTEFTYKLTYKNGDVSEKTCLLSEPVSDNKTTIVDNVDSNDVSIYFNLDYDSYYLSAYIDYEDWGLYDSSEGSASEACSCSCHKGGALNTILNSFLCAIWKMLGVKNVCQCGVEHW